MTPRFSSCCLLILFLSFQGDASEPELSDGTGQHRLEITQGTRFESRESLRALCRVDFEVRGCTAVPTVGISCDCVRTPDGWLIRARATLETITYLSGPRVINHELLHIRDIQEGVQNTLDIIEETVYPTERSCRQMSGIFSSPSYARAVMTRILEQSTRKRQCRRHSP